MCITMRMEMKGGWKRGWKWEVWLSDSESDYGLPCGFQACTLLPLMAERQHLQ